MSDGLFELAPAPVTAGDQVDVTMPWGHVWRCTVARILHDGGWPVAELSRNDLTDLFTVDVARCRLVESQPSLDGL